MLHPRNKSVLFHTKYEDLICLGLLEWVDILLVKARELHLIIPVLHSIPCQLIYLEQLLLFEVQVLNTKIGRVNLDELTQDGSNSGISN